MFNALEPQPYGMSPYPPTNAAPARPASSILPAPQFSNTLPETEEDTEPIREWRERQAKEIEERNAAAREKRDEMANKAEKAIDQFYEDYNKQKEKNIRENKEKEAAFVEKLKEDIAKGTSWERVTDLIGLENSRECWELRVEEAKRSRCSKPVSDALLVAPSAKLTLQSPRRFVPTSRAARTSRACGRSSSLSAARARRPPGPRASRQREPMWRDLRQRAQKLRPVGERVVGGSALLDVMQPPLETPKLV